MANNNIEKYLEAMLAVLNGDNPPDVPTPSWNIEKYLAAILTSLENGGGSDGALVVNSDSGTLDKTWQEINDAFPMVRVEYEGGVSCSVACVVEEEGSYKVSVWDGEVEDVYITNSADGYPTNA